MKFDYIDWKILAFKVGKKKRFFEHYPTISDDFDFHLWKHFALQALNLKFFCIEKLSWKSRKKIEQKHA